MQVRGSAKALVSVCFSAASRGFGKASKQAAKQSGALPARTYAAIISQCETPEDRHFRLLSAVSRNMALSAEARLGS